MAWRCCVPRRHTQILPTAVLLALLSTTAHAFSSPSVPMRGTLPAVNTITSRPLTNIRNRNTASSLRPLAPLLSRTALARKGAAQAHTSMSAGLITGIGTSAIISKAAPIVKAPVGIAALVATPDLFFQSLFLALAVSAACFKILDRDSSGKAQEKAPDGVRSLQMHPDAGQIIGGKIIGGKPVSLDLVSKLFLIGFGTTGLLGPSVGKVVDSKGRKAGTLAFALLYTVGALSVRSPILGVLILGRLAGGIGTSLLFSAPESWLVGEHIKGGFDGKWLSQTFGWAYAGDSLVAIAAGQLAGLAASQRGPAGPFEISVAFLAAGALISAFKWKENVAPSVSKSGPTIPESWNVMMSSRKILLVGAVQSLFEGAMYIFVLQWPPSLIAVVNGAVPFGKVFSCFMAACLLGSTLFGALSKRGVQVETATGGMLVAAASSMAVAATCGSSFASVVAAFLVFEMCVGMYFPSIGTLRSKHLPDSHRSVIVNIFGVPLNLIVVSVFLSIKRLGVSGALMCSTLALSLAAIAQILLIFEVNKSATDASK